MCSVLYLYYIILHLNCMLIMKIRFEKITQKQNKNKKIKKLWSLSKCRPIFDCVLCQASKMELLTNTVTVNYFRKKFHHGGYLYEKRDGIKTRRDNFYPTFLKKTRRNNLCTSSTNESFWIKMQREHQSDCPIILG